VFDYSIQQWGKEVFHTKTMEKMLKRRQGAEVKRKIKRREVKKTKVISPMT
jgi:hypothetical protein